MDTTMNKDFFGTPPTGDPGGDDTVDNKDKDNPSGGSSDDDPSLSNKVNLDCSRVPMIISVFSTLPTNRLLQIPMRRVFLLF